MTFPDSSGAKNFEIPVSSGLLTAEHVQRMGNAIWLELLLENMVEGGDGDQGIVSKGRAILDRELGAPLGKSEKTIARYRDTLITGGYILTQRKAEGYTYFVLRSKKWQVLQRVRTMKNGRSGLDKSVLSDRTEVSERSDRSVRCYKETTSLPLKAAATAAPSLNLEPWEAIGLDRPAGDLNFQQSWGAAWAGKNGSPLSRVMGDCANACQDAGVTVPARFFRELARIRQREKLNSETQALITNSKIPTVRDIVPKER